MTATVVSKKPCLCFHWSPLAFYKRGALLLLLQPLPWFPLLLPRAPLPLMVIINRTLIFSLGVGVVRVIDWLNMGELVFCTDRLMHLLWCKLRNLGYCLIDQGCSRFWGRSWCVAEMDLVVVVGSFKFWTFGINDLICFGYIFFTSQPRYYDELIIVHACSSLVHFLYNRMFEPTCACFI